MAIIKCSKCGQEISDRAEKCVHCGEPVTEESGIQFCKECGSILSQNSAFCEKCGCPTEIIEALPQVKNRHSKNRFIVVTTILTIFVTFIFAYSIFKNNPDKIYSNAIEMIGQGDYDKSIALLASLDNYNNSDELQEQLKYETYTYSAIRSIKSRLKSPNSFYLHEILFFDWNLDKETDESDKNAKLSSQENKDNTEDKSDTNKMELPVCIVHYSAQNGFGGNSESYAAIEYKPDIGEYAVVSECDSINLDNYDEKTKDEAESTEYATCLLINLFLRDSKVIGSIDIDRVRAMVDNGMYSKIEIIR